MTRVMVIRRSEHPITDKGLGVVPGVAVEYQTAEGAVDAIVVEARVERDRHTYRLTLEIPDEAARLQLRQPVCPVCGGPADEAATEHGRGMQCRGPCE